MPRFTAESLEALRQRIDLVDAISTYVPLKRAGAAYKGLCPFHDEKTPSFMIQKGDSHYHCFGCGAHGDAIQFLMQHLKMTFSDAVMTLAEKFQVPLEEVKGKDSEPGVNKARLKEALDCANQCYHFYLLHTEEGQEALSYLYNRGITLQFIRQFRLGLAPKQEGFIKKILNSHGFFDKDLLEAGLLADRGGRLREFFQERITFPIQDAAGSIIGFSARKYKESTFGGKYINTPETVLFKKSRILFGLNYCRRRIAKERHAIIVEGQLDALRLIHHGFNITVAGLGTAFGEAHAKELIQLGVRRVYLLFDADRAGQEAVVKVGDIFQKEGIEVFVIFLPDQMDPDELLMKNGPVVLARSFLHATDYLTFIFHHLSKDVSLSSPSEKNQLLQDICKRIRDWDNPVVIHESLKKLAHLAQVPMELLGVGSYHSHDVYVQKTMRAQIGTTAIDPDRILEADLVRWIFVLGNESQRLCELCRVNLSEVDFRTPVAWKILSAMLDLCSKQQAFDLISLSLHVDDSELDSFLSLLLSRKINRDKAEQQLLETIQKIKERNWMLMREELKMKIHSGEGKEEEVLELVKQFDDLKKKPPQVVVFPA